MKNLKVVVRYCVGLMIISYYFCKNRNNIENTYIHHYKAFRNNHNSQYKKRIFYGNTNRKGPKEIQVPKARIVFVANILNSTKNTFVMNLGKWMLATHNNMKVYIPPTQKSLLTSDIFDP